MSNGKRKGKEGEKNVKHLLKHYAKAHHGKLLNGIYLPLYKGCCEVDHILFGDFGIAVIETKNISGTVLGNAADKYLTHKIGTKQHKLYNPLLQNETHCSNIRHHLSKAGIRDVPIYPFVVYADEEIFIQNPSLGVKLINLENRLNQLKPANYSAEKFYRIILAQKVRNPFKKIIHNIKIKFKNNS